MSVPIFAADEPRTEHTILVAVVVEAPTREDAHLRLATEMPGYRNALRPHSPVLSWWVAEDDRLDGSDNDSAVFVHPGSQHVASRVLAGLDFTYPHNIVNPEVKDSRFDGRGI